MSRLDVLYAARDNYAMTLGVSIESLCANNADIGTMTIYVLDDEISPANKDLLVSVGEKYSRRVELIDVAGLRAQLVALGVEPHKGTYTTYYKLLAVNALPAGADRVLYLDCDTIVEGSLLPLVDVPLSGPCGGTYDCMLNSHKSAIGLDPHDRYYNCGVILVDRAAWRAERYEERIVDHLTSVRATYYIVDQDIMNVLFHDEYTYIDLRYDVNPSFEIYGVEATLAMYDLRPAYYNSADEVRTELAVPVVLHCMGAMTGRPWEQNNIHPWNDLFDYYRSMTPWASTPKTRVRIPRVFWLQRQAYRLLPRAVYVRAHRLAYSVFLSRRDAATRT
ncbi:MAG: hypothetical protein FWE61_00915 [Micrococcales bacterium]|nr:hypothetical protein [Micrococcales bacterium]